MRKALLAAGMLLFIPVLDLSAQTKVYYPDNAVGSSSGGWYPIWPSSRTARGQTLLPGNFSGLPKTGGLVTKVGCLLGGQADYTTFIIRVGITKQKAMTTTFATNLPDQRIQVDLSGTKLIGGGTPAQKVNKWVEFDLCNPFFWNPGDYICIDFTCKTKVSTVWCGTEVGRNPFVPRMINTNYTPTKTTGSLISSGGIKTMIVIADPTKVVPYDKGCAGTNNITPVLSHRGSTKIGSGVLFLDLTKALAKSPCAVAIGLKCQNFRLNSVCTVNPSLDILVFGTTSTTGTFSIGGKVPTNTQLRGRTFYTQYAIADPKAQSGPYGLSLSNTGIIVLN